jgi:nucleoside-diphosphate-sugar epimerase
MRSLVTGAGGFLGRHLVQRLVERGGQVRALVRRPSPGLAVLGVEVVQGDVRDEEAVRAACRGVEVVFHLAAVAGIWGPWEHFYGVNTLGTKHVVAGCLAEGVRKLVYTSSPSVTFDGTDQCGVDETVPYARRWLCHYPHTKALAERHVLACNGQRELLTCALRPHLIWGPGDPHLIPRLLDRARRGQLMRIGDGRNRIDMVYVDNAVDAHLQAAQRLDRAESRVAGSAYFISQGEPVSCWGWIDELLGLAGLPPVRRQISFSTAWRIGRALELVYGSLRLRAEPRMTRFLAAQLALSHYFDISRARNELGYEPRVSTEEGMRRLEASSYRRCAAS